MRSNRVLKSWYNLVNRKFFNNELPPNVCVRYLSELEIPKFESKYYAWTSKLEGRHCYCIVICKAKNPGRTAKAASLVHEMLHVATEMKDNHGPAFEAKRQMISDRGVFRKGAVLDGLTIF